MREGHRVEPFGDLVGELVDPADQFGAGHAPLVAIAGRQFEFADSVCQRATPGFEVVECDRSGLIGVDQPALLRLQFGELMFGHRCRVVGRLHAGAGDQLGVA